MVLEGIVDSVDSTAFESFVTELKNFRQLTGAEEAMVKRVTKKIKNRESARKSRQAKKDHNADLESKVNDLSDQNQDLKLQMAALESENRTIRNEITFAETLITQHPFLSKLYHMALAQRDGNTNNPGTSNATVSSLGGTVSMGSGGFGSVHLGAGAGVGGGDGAVKQQETVSPPRVLAY